MATMRVEVASTTSVDIQLLIERPKAALLGILRRLEGWRTACEGTITVEQFSGAMTNLVYRCGLKEDGKEELVVLMRVHASASDLFDRAAEISTFQGVSKAGLGPKLLMLFDNGRVEEFLTQHVTLAAADLHDAPVSCAIAETMAHFHICMSDALADNPYHQGPVQLWERLHDWFRLTCEHCSEQELRQLGMAGLDEEIHQLQEVLTGQHPCWVALCHNDLQYGNIMALAAPEGAHRASDAAEASTCVSPEHQLPQSREPAAVGELSKQLAGLEVDQSPAAAAAAAAKGDATMQPGQALVATAAALQKHHQTSSSSSSLAHRAELFCGHSIESLPSEATDISGMAMAGTSPTASLTSLERRYNRSGSSLNLRGRSPGRSVQLSDGSFVLPGMKARPRGQSPERGKRPDYFTDAVLNPLSTSSSSGGVTGRQRSAPAAARGNLGSCGSGALGILAVAGGPKPAAGQGLSDAAVGAGAGAGRSTVGGGLESQGSLVGPVDGEIKPPSAAAVMRHSSSAGELFISAGLPGAAGAGAAAAEAEAAGTVRRPGRISTTGLDTSESADDSEAADDILPVPAMSAVGSPEAAAGAAAGRVRGAAAERSSRSAVARRRVDSPSELAEDAAAAASRSAAQFRKLRRERRKPAAGIEFPTFHGSDVEDSSGSGSDYGLSEDEQADVPCSIGSGSSSSGLSDDEQPGTRRSRSSRKAAPAAAGHSKGPSTLPDSSALSPTAAAAAQAAAGVAFNSSTSSPRSIAGAHTQKALTFIDYEYSGFNPVAYDIANHWCEWAADYHTDQPHVLDFSKLPNEEQQQAFVEDHLRALLVGLGVSAADLEELAAAATAGHGSGLTAAAAAWRSDAGSSVGGAAEEAAERDMLEDMWSTLSSRGGSVYSMPEPDGFNDAASERSVALSTKSDRSSMQPDAPAVPKLSNLAAAAAGSQPGGIGLAASAGGAAAGGLSAAALRSVWRWIDLHQPDRLLLMSQRVLDALCFRRMVASLLAASKAYMACSHLLWALWGVIQSKVSDVDFDFEVYAQQRWQQYLLSRPAGLQQR